MESLAIASFEDRHEANLARAVAHGIGAAGVRVAPGAILRLADTRSVGENCFIGLYCYLNGDVTLEDEVIIGPHCVLTANTHLFEPETQAFTGNVRGRIRIGRGTWICAGCTITSGVTVGAGNLICANSVVTRNTPDFAIMAGTPARQIGSIDPQTGDYCWLK